jgi:hypothetical protein
MPEPCEPREDGTPETHPGAEELARFVRGELPRPEARLIVRHLLTRCPRCTQVTRRLWELGDRAPGFDVDGEDEGEDEEGGEEE